MTRTTTTAAKTQRAAWQAMRAENLAIAEQLDIIGADYACDTYKSNLPIKCDPHIIRSGRLMVRAMPYNAQRLAAKFRTAADRLPARRASRSAEPRKFPKFEPGMSTAEYVAAFVAFNGGSSGAHVLPYDLAAYRNPCTLYEGGDIDFEPIEQPIDAPDLAADEPQPVAIVSALTGATLGTVPRHVADQVAELIASATTAAEEARKAANRGKSIVERRADAVLSKEVRDSETGTVMTRAQWVERRVNDGARPSIEMVDKIKPMSRTQFNRASNAEQRAHEAKIKAGGKVPEYSLGDYIVSKTEYDYAQKLIASATTAAVIEQASEAAPMVTLGEPVQPAVGSRAGVVPGAVGKALKAQVDSAEPMTEAHVNAIEAYQSHLTAEAKKSLEAGDMPVFQSGNVTVSIGPSAQKPGMFQATRYNNTGAIGDSQYKTIEQAIRGESLVNSELLEPGVAQKRMADVAKAESAFQDRSRSQSSGQMKGQQASTTETAHDTHQAPELATVDACSESSASATTCDASSAGNAPSAPQNGRASSTQHQAPTKPTHDAYGQRIGQRVAGNSGHWRAVIFTDPDGRPSFEFKGPGGLIEVLTFATGRERMAALQAMARQADQAAETDDDDDETERERRLNAFDAMTTTAADVQAMGAEYVAQLLEDLEDINYHTEGLILQALAAGREDLAARARANLREHLAAGYLTDALRLDRQAIGEALRQSTKQRAYKGLFALVTKRQARELWNIGEPIGLLTYKRNTPFECDTMNAEYKAFNSFDEKVTDAESQLRSGERIYFYAPAEHTGYAPPAPDAHQQTAPVPNLADKVPRAVGADSGPASNPPGATAPSAPAPSAPAPSAPAPDTEASADEPEPEFTRTRPQPFDMLAMIAAGLAPDDFVGLGIVYSGDRANPSGRGAITDVQPCSWYKYTITVTLEDGRQSRLNPVSFTEHLGNRYKTDFKRHGAPYLAELAAARLAVEAADKAAKQAAADDKARQRRELPQQWPQLKAYDHAGKLNGPTLAAHNIRVLLKEKFPKVKFSVKSDKFSGGDSISIRWTDGPSAKSVEEISNMFEAGSFNGMEDIYEYSHSTFRDLFGDAKYIHVNRDHSDAAIAQAIEALYLNTEGRPTVEDYRKARGMFDYHENRGAIRRLEQRLDDMGDGFQK